MEKIIIIVVAVTVLILFFGFIIILYALAYQRRKNRHAKEKQQMEARFTAAILQTQVEIQEQTLKNIAQEIHDNIGQVLILAKLNLNTFPPIPDEATATKVTDTKHLVGKAINDLRDLSRSLHGDKISELGLPDSISNEIRILQNTGLYQTKLNITGNKYRMQPQKEMIFFRIVQECINNAVKHAAAKQLEFSLLYEPTVFRMSIADDGKGFDPATLKSAETGIGLKNMKDRAGLIGATLHIHSSPGNGTRVEAELLNPEI
jgi:two-component system, NarL family, sensor kinase